MVINISNSDEFSLYFHIPFCKRKCDYCHFYVIPDKEQHKVLLLDSLKKEWANKLSDINTQSKLKSVYFGGGTPSLFGPERIANVLGWVNDLFSTKNIEVTLEVNPEDVTISLIKAFITAGVNRISMGVQSLNDGELQLLTRRHDAHRAISAIEQIKEAGIDNLSIDLMYDLPHQTTASWKSTIQKASQLPIDHLSLYNLTIEPHTVYYKYKNQLEAAVPEESVSYDMYTYAIDALQSSGLYQYEISAFAGPGKYSIHNTGYWTGRPFLGLGPSAYSFWKGTRFRNIPNINKYAKSLESGISPVDLIDELPKDERLKEMFVVALRILDGVDLESFENLIGPLRQETKSAVDTLVSQGLLHKEGVQIRLTKKGILLYDSIATELI